MTTINKPAILITGASGFIGSFIVPLLSDDYTWKLTDKKPLPKQSKWPFILSDLTDIKSALTLCEHTDIVVHLAATSKPDSQFADLLSNNILATHNLFQAACQCGCKRVIFASSIHVVDGYPEDVTISSSMPVMPLTLYGVSKAFGESLAAYYAFQKNISVICLRIGWVIPRDDGRICPKFNHLHKVITPEDLFRLIVASIQAPMDVRFGIFAGLSNNRIKRLDISDTVRVLGYNPQDDSYLLAERKKLSLIKKSAQWVRRAGRKLFMLR